MMAKLPTPDVLLMTPAAVCALVPVTVTSMLLQPDNA
jgi:hypothetical protein